MPSMKVDVFHEGSDATSLDFQVFTYLALLQGTEFSKRIFDARFKGQGAGVPAAVAVAFEIAELSIAIADAFREVLLP